MSDGNPFLLPGARPGAPPGPGRGTAAPIPPDAPGPAPRAGWRLLLPDGERIALDRAIVIGRDPSQLEEAPDAHPVPVADPQKTVSKTHALLLPDPAGVRVRDLHSTNGTTLVLPGGRAPVPAEGELLVSQPADLELGRYRVRIEG